MGGGGAVEGSGMGEVFNRKGRRMGELTGRNHLHDDGNGGSG